MTCLQFFRYPFHTLVVVVGATCTLALPLHRETPREPKAASPKSGLLQASSNETREAQQRPLGIDFFSEDADRIAQMPPYIPKKLHACEPRCFYTCGHSECDQSCEPVCLPPKCETLCTKSADHCETRCAKPKCAVVCPQGADYRELQQPFCKDCPKCRTICAPPACTTSCSDSCHSVCAQPECTWKCKLGYCPKPSCKLNCENLSPCHDFPHRNLTKVPRMLGMDIKNVDKASLDPTVLATPVLQPTEDERVMPTSQPQNTLKEDFAPESKMVSPVKALKMQWEANDMVEANARLLRR